jgi:hypothetical protein
MSKIHRVSQAPAAARFTQQRRGLLAALLGAAGLPGWAASSSNPSPGAGMLSIDWRGTAFIHRWSKDGQHEFTPASSPDLASWRDMLTLNVHDSIRNGEQLAQVANKVLANYQQHGKILQTRSMPRTAERPAEHLIVAVLGTPQLLEAVFARCMLHDGIGVIAVLSRRIYGQAVGPQMSEWLRNNGPQTEQALMSWSSLPSIASLKQLPTSA